jgi:DNA repair exonuclease SbcCD ATPase subunit
LVEQIVDFVLGFVICGLIGLAFLPLVSRRARRLTLARIEARLPMTFDEIEAERDLLRARFAVELRALEIKTAQERKAHAEDEAELGRRALAIRQAKEQWAHTAALLDETQAKLAQALDFGEKTQAELIATRETLAARAQELEQRNRDYQDLGEAHRELENRAARLEAALEKADRRLADFDARRKRLLGKFVAERQRGDDFEKTTLDLRRALEDAGAAENALENAPVLAVGSDGVAFPITPEREMLELREAIARIGHQVAQFDAARD